MISNRRSFLKTVVGVFGMVVGGALLPKVVDIPNKVLLVNGKEIAEYVEAKIFSKYNWLFVTLSGEEWERMCNHSFPFPWKNRNTIGLQSNGNIQEFRCEYVATTLPYGRRTQAILSFDIKARMF